jgi:hypothetical protein
MKYKPWPGGSNEPFPKRQWSPMSRDSVVEWLPSDDLTQSYCAFRSVLDDVYRLISLLNEHRDRETKGLLLRYCVQEIVNSKSIFESLRKLLIGTTHLQDDVEARQNLDACLKGTSKTFKTFWETHRSIRNKVSSHRDLDYVEEWRDLQLRIDVKLLNEVVSRFRELHDMVEQLRILSWYSETKDGAIRFRQEFVGRNISFELTEEK